VNVSAPVKGGTGITGMTKNPVALNIPSLSFTGRVGAAPPGRMWVALILEDKY